LASAAQAKNIFDSEITPIKDFSKDEHVRPDSSLQALSRLKPVFKKEGVVTAGNASGICDGAAALVLTRNSIAQQNGWQMLATVVSSAVVGCDPKEMGIGPVAATHTLLTKTSLKKENIKLIEINEAFAAQVIAVQKELQFPEEKLNGEGGAIAIGHPLGASGARLCVHLTHRLTQLGGGYGIGTACIGGGQGMAMLLKVG
jgi:acetyl-CoA acetyltransferase family protein